MSFSEDYFTGAGSPYRKGYESAVPHLQSVYERTSGIVAKWPNTTATLLDVGCAYGYFLGCWAEKGVEMWGIDISEHAISVARQVAPGAHLSQASIHDGLPYEDARFDLITMLDVLQMLENPAAALREVARVLKPGGLFIVTAPNVNSIFRFVRGSQWTGFRDKHHLYLFTPASLAFLLKRTGFEVVEMKTPQLWPFPKRLAWLAFNMPFGSGLWAVATKRVGGAQ